MKLHHIITNALLCLCASAALLSCTDKQELESQIADLEKRVDDLNEIVSTTNANNIALKALLDTKTLILSHEITSDGVRLSLSDGSTVEIFYGKTAPWVVPVLGIDTEGRWIVSLDGGETFDYVKKTSNIHDGDGASALIGIDKEGYWTISFDEGKTTERILDENGSPISANDAKQVAGKYSFFKSVTYDPAAGEMVFNLMNGQSISVPVLETFFVKAVGYKENTPIYRSEVKAYLVETSELANAVFSGPEGWGAVLEDSEIRITAPAEAPAGEYTISLLAVSTKGYLRRYDYTFILQKQTIDEIGCKIWADFAAASPDNILLDYSYAGYHHGEEAPADVYTLGYKVYDVTDYGAVANDGKSDREAFLNCVKAALGVNFSVEDRYIVFDAKPKANAIIYFPEGDFILHTSADDSENYSREIMIRSGNIVLKGAGRDKTRIVMQDPNLPANEEMYSSPVMLSFRNWSGLSDFATPVEVTADAPKGGFSVKVNSTAGMKAGDWVCLWAEVSDSDYIAAELAPYEAKAEWDISKLVYIYDYHQIKSIENGEVTFVEPLMHAVDASRKFMIKNYPHYENVGVEDITFAANAKHDFLHHGSWEDDGGFKPLTFMRCVNSWVRRCDFESTSEAMTFHTSANCSGYDCRFTGWRGHASMRSASSSRIFIGATQDRTKGPVGTGNPQYSAGTMLENAGQFHAVGVNGPTMGTVIWRNLWGDDACFEAHADQCRATLIDCCKGGWMEYRQGGGTAALPNHLADLTIWNFEATTNHKANYTSDGTMLWWATGSRSINFLPPIIVGFHGGSCLFNPSSVVVDDSHGTPVSPESLYEAQLVKRLGAVPAWLNSLK